MSCRLGQLGFWAVSSAVRGAIGLTWVWVYLAIFRRAALRHGMLGPHPGRPFRVPRAHAHREALAAVPGRTYVRFTLHNLRYQKGLDRAQSATQR